ncbi:hypothetical protein LINPERHAP2_LOCUS32561 [Linum perenne]
MGNRRERGGDWERKKGCSAAEGITKGINSRVGNWEQGRMDTSLSGINYLKISLLIAVESRPTLINWRTKLSKVARVDPWEYDSENSQVYLVLGPKNLFITPR